jgi:Spy/CpxP family protein refolding chaperone
MTRPIALASVLGLFLLGILVGALSMHLYDAYAIRATRGSAASPEDSLRPGGFFWQRMQERLDLTPEQRDRIEQILDDARAEGETLHHDLMPRVHELMERTHARLMEVLTPVQRETFEQLHLRQQRGAELFFLGHGPARGHRRGPGRRWRDDGGKGTDRSAPDPTSPPGSDAGTPSAPTR